MKKRSDPDHYWNVHAEKYERASNLAKKAHERGDQKTADKWVAVKNKAGKKMKYWQRVMKNKK